MGIKTASQPPYSPDLAPCDFWLFPKLRGCRYETIEEMKRAHSFLLVWEIDGETYNQRGDFFLSHIFFLEPGGCNACTPLQAMSSERSETPLIGCVSIVTFQILCTLSKSDRVVITWSPSGYTPVGLDCPDALSSLFINHNVTAYQSTRTGSLGTNRKSMPYVI